MALFLLSYCRGKRLISHFRNIAILFILFLAMSCQSVIRFSSEKKYISVSKEKETKYSTIEGKLTENKEYLEKYKNLEPIRIKIIKEAESWIGTPYKYGGTNSSGIDCSGFVQNVFDKCGITLPRTSQQQYTYTMRVTSDELEPGDLIFFGNKGNISHVGIFGGSGYMIHASTSAGVVKQNLQDYANYQTVQGYGKAYFK